MTNTIGPISLASILPSRRATTPPTPRLHASSAPIGLAAAARHLVVAKVTPTLAIERATLRKTPALAFASQTRASKSKPPPRFPP